MKLKKLIPTAILSAAAVLMLSACGAQKVDVSQYVDVTFNGLDGRGTAQLSTSGLNGAIEEIILGDDQSLEDFFENYDILDAVEGSVKAELNTNSELSNGDIVIVNITVDNETAKKNGIEFVGTDPIKVTVSGLQEVTEIDPFDPQYFNIESGEGIYIEFTGTSPWASLQIRNTLPDSNPLSKVTYSSSDAYDFTVKKGQSITITAHTPSSFENEGYVLTSSETTVICEKVAEYITSIDDIDNDTMKKIIDQCTDLKTANLDGNGSYICYVTDDGSWKSVKNDIESVTDFKFSKEYFFSLKDGLNYRYGDMSENGLFISYTVNLNKVKKDFWGDKKVDVKNAVGYFYIYDIMKDINGEIQFSSNMVNMGSYIYKDKATFKIEVLNGNIDSFTMTEQDYKE